jgi:hypothetical protein
MLTVRVPYASVYYITLQKSSSLSKSNKFGDYISFGDIQRSISDFIHVIWARICWQGASKPFLLWLVPLVGESLGIQVHKILLEFEIKNYSNNIQDIVFLEAINYGSCD